MKYMGSKNKHAKSILDNILKYVSGDLSEYTWVEPFVGGCNMIDKVGDLFDKKIGNDAHYYLIEMFKGIQSGWLPPDYVSLEDYNKFRDKAKKEIKDADSALIGFVGFGCSYSGKWFGGYARGKDNKGIDRNYCLESKKNILKQKEGILNVELSNLNYLDLNIPDKSIIYCDPPYAGTTKYKDKFNHVLFWEWCEKQVKNGSLVFVSEYSAPKDWNCIWSVDVFNSLTKDTGSKIGTEKLFTKSLTI